MKKFILILLGFLIAFPCYGEIRYERDVGATLRAVGVDLLPDTDDTYDIGSEDLRWKDIYASGGITGETVTIGATTLPAGINFGTILYGANVSGSTVARLETYSVTVGHNPQIVFRHSRSDAVGTYAETETATVLGGFSFQGIDNTNVAGPGITVTTTQDGAAGTDIPTNLRFKTWDATGGNTDVLVLNNEGNTCLGTQTSGANAQFNLVLSGGATAPTTSNTAIHLYGGDPATSDSTVLNIYQEEAVIADNQATVTHKMPIMINGTEYSILLNAS